MIRLTEKYRVKALQIIEKHRYDEDKQLLWGYLEDVNRDIEDDFGSDKDKTDEEIATFNKDTAIMTKLIRPVFKVFINSLPKAPDWV